MAPTPDMDRPSPNWAMIGLMGGLVLLVLLVAYFATNRNADQDKLTNGSSHGASAGDPEKNCASKATYDLIKRELFRRAADMRGSDQAAYDKLAAYAVVRMENPVMESQDKASGAVNCSASLSLDLPPGVAVVGGRRILAADIDYSVRQAADDSGPVLLLRNADAIIAPLATLGKAGAAAPQAPAATATVDDSQSADTDVTDMPEPTPPIEPARPQPGPPPVAPSRPASARPSFNCANARTRSELAVCGDAGLAQLDRSMAAQFNRSLANASPEQAALLRRTRDRFLGFRDRCSNNACIGDAYTGRMREIRDIMEDRWQPTR
ncbi:MAG: hypothetical protein ABIO80_06990 [Sphingomicrobium sp.]